MFVVEATWSMILCYGCPSRLMTIWGRKIEGLPLFACGKGSCGHMSCNLRYTHHHSGGALFSGELAGEENMRREVL